MIPKDKHTKRQTDQMRERSKGKDIQDKET